MVETILSDDDITAIVLNELARQPDGFMTGTALHRHILATVSATWQFPTIVAGKTTGDLGRRLIGLADAPDDNFGLETKGLADYVPARNGWRITERGRIMVTARILA